MNDPALPHRLAVVARAGDQPLPGAWFELELPMRTKCSYRVPVGPADENGEFRVSDAELRSAVERINDLFPMDYVGLNAGWTGELVLRPVDRQVLARLQDAYLTWRETGFYPARFAEHLAALKRTLDSLPREAPLQVTATVEPAGSPPVRTLFSRVGGAAP
jgi:hypothetical protein